MLVHETDDKLRYEQLRKLLASEVKGTGATEQELMLVLARSARGHRELSKLKGPDLGRQSNSSRSTRRKG